MERNGEKCSKKTQSKYVCEKCDFKSNNKNDYTRHLQTKKHNANKVLINANKLVCNCGKIYKHSSSLSRHKNKCKTILGAKSLPTLTENDETIQKDISMNIVNNAKMVKNDNKMVINDNKMVTQFVCNCGNSYKYTSGLSRHKKTCTYKPPENSIISSTDTSEYNHLSNKEIIAALHTSLQTNKELQNKIIAIAEEPRVINNTTNKFNLKNFLNVECKDAMNLTEFLNQLTITFQDLLYLGNNGFVKSIESTMVKQLKNMEQTKRPMHCTDKKRKVIYVKETNRWEKDDEHTKLQKSILQVNHKQMTSLSKHKNECPDWLDKDDKNLDKQNNIIQGVCSYNNDTKVPMNAKIITTLIENILLDK